MYFDFETYLSISLVEEMVSGNVSIDQLSSSIRKYANFYVQLYPQEKKKRWRTMQNFIVVKNHQNKMH